MQLGKSVVGALVGGALGIAALIGIYFATGWDKAWLAIVVALFTGLGVRSFAATKGHASYARGALTAVVAIGAFLAWYPIVAAITVRAAPAKPIVADPALVVAANEDAAEADEEPAAPAPVETAERSDDSVVPQAGLPKPRGEQAAWDIVWLCIAGLIAYELGRGTSAAAPRTGAAGSPDDGPPAPLDQPQQPT